MLKIERVSIDNLKEIMSDEDFNQTVFTTYQWVCFLKKNGKGEPVVFRISENSKVIAFFVGLVFKVLGLRFVGSPFEGWGTCDMGFCAKRDVDVSSLIVPVKNYVFKKLKCSYLEIVDPKIGLNELSDIRCNVILQRTLILPINRLEQDIFHSFKGDCRNYIRQFERRGATITEALPSREFADEYYDQLIQVFAKQKLRPFYDKKKVYDLMDTYENNADHILCLRVCNPEGICIATSIFIGFKETFYFWGNASYTEFQNYRPNEYMIWYAIKYWKERGVVSFDMVGFREYKRKFSPNSVEYPRIVLAKYPGMYQVRNFTKRLIQLVRKVIGQTVL